MTDNESFDDRFNRWTLAELKVELTRTNIYGPRKLSRIQTQIAELEKLEQVSEQSLVKHETNWVKRGIIIALVGVIVAVIGILYANSN